jgi:hypothetical protein
VTCAAIIGETIVGDAEARSRAAANTAALPACGMLVAGLENDSTVRADFAALGIAGEGLLSFDDFDGEVEGGTS